MKTSPLSIIFFLALLLALCEQPAHAQWILGVSSLTQNSTARTIQGTSSTQMDYNTQLYYAVYVRGYIYTQDPNVRLASQEAHGSNGTASVNTQISNVTPGATYNLRTEHFFGRYIPVVLSLVPAASMTIMVISIERRSTPLFRITAQVRPFSTMGCTQRITHLITFG